MIRTFWGDALVNEEDEPGALVVTVGKQLPDVLVHSAECVCGCSPRVEPALTLHMAGDVEIRTSDGIHIERATVRDENGDVVTNLVQIPNAYDLALRWSKHVDAQKYFDNARPSEQWQEWDEGEKPAILCRRIWREMAAAVDLVGATIDVELPTGLDVFCEGCGWKGKDYAMIPPNAACPECAKLFTVTEVPR